MAGARGEHGDVPREHAVDRCPRPLREVDAARPGLLGHLECAAVRGGGVLGRGGDRLDDGAGHGVLAGSGIEPELGGRRDHVRPAGDRSESSDRRSGVRRGTGDPGHGGDGCCGRDDRVTPVAHERRARVVALPGEPEAPAAVPEDVRRERDGRPEVDESAPLLDVQLDERADAGQTIRIRTDGGRVDAGGGEHCLQAGAVRIGQRERAFRADGTAQQARPEAGDTEACALLLGEDGDRRRSRRAVPLLLQTHDGVERRDDAERAVEGAAAGDRVEVRARDERIGPRCAPPCPGVAVPVVLDVEAEALRPLDEPVAEVALGVVEQVPGVPAADGVPPDLGDLGQPREDRRARVGHAQTSHMGTRRPRSRATSSARS